MKHPSFLGAGVCPLIVATALLWCGAERCLAQASNKVVIHGEVVATTGDKVRVAVGDQPLPQFGDPVKITYEIRGAAIRAHVATGKVTGLEAEFASVGIIDKTSEIRNGYKVEIISAGPSVDKKPPTDSKVPAPISDLKPESKTDPDGPPKAGTDLSGDWEATLHLGKSIWALQRRFDGRYDAQQKDFGKATGIGVFADGMLRIEWETEDGYAGIEEWRINSARNAGKGRGIGVKRFTGEHDVTVVRLSTPSSTPGGLDEKTRAERHRDALELGKVLIEKRDFAGAVKAYREALEQFPDSETTLRMLRHAEKLRATENAGSTDAPNDLSGRWREEVEGNAPIWTLTRQADGKYQVRQDVAGHPSSGCTGTAEYVKGALTVMWVQDKLKNKGSGEWKIDLTQMRGSASHYIFSFTGRDDRNYRCGITRLTGNPAADLKSDVPPVDLP